MTCLKISSTLDDALLSAHVVFTSHTVHYMLTHLWEAMYPYIRQPKTLGCALAKGGNSAFVAPA